MTALRNYVLVTIAYWSFTLSDGALRMLVLLHFYHAGFNPIQLAFLFLFYEFFGIVTNLLGGWLASRMGLKVTMTAGLAIQVVALVLLALVAPDWPRAWSVAYVMALQALSGISKDLTKMSAKSAIKVLVPEHAPSTLFTWVAILTGSKNALKGVGFFLGGLLLTVMGFRASLWAMALGLVVIFAGSQLLLPQEMGKSKRKRSFTALFAKSRDINVLSAARFFLFGARDVWFVVGVPVFLATTLGWGFTEVGGFLAAWVIGYGIVQAGTPGLVRYWTRGLAPQGRAALVLAGLLMVSMAAIPVSMRLGLNPTVAILGGLGLFGVVFAINSSVHSYLILAYSDGDQVAVNVGFYYMANAGGRLIGTLLSGLMYGIGGLQGCLWTSVAFAAAAAGISWALPRTTTPIPIGAAPVEGGE